MLTLMRRDRAVLAAVAVALSCASGRAGAQLTPDRLYYGVDRPIPMHVARPAGREGELRVTLHEPGAPEPSASAAVVVGGVDLASLFPSLWSAKSHEVLFAQLWAGDSKTGAPVVLQPMTTPPIVMLYSREKHIPYFVDPVTNTPSFEPRTGDLVYTPGEQGYAGIRGWVDKHAVFETDLGSIEFALRPDEAPNTVRTFMDLVEGGFYTDIIF